MTMERGIIITLLALLMGSAAQGQSSTGTATGLTFSVIPSSPPAILAAALNPDGIRVPLKMDAEGNVYAKCVN